jgi:hypothetical protein
LSQHSFKKHLCKNFFVLRSISKNIAFLWVALSSLVMGLSLKVGHFEKNTLLVSHSDFAGNEVPNHWVDYFLMEIAETGEDLPEKHVGQRDSKTGFRKKTSKAKLNLTLPFDASPSVPVENFSQNSLGANCLVPLPGYYGSLHLFHLF